MLVSISWNDSLIPIKNVTMRINLNETILGVPNLEIRRLLRRNRDNYHSFDIDYLTEVLEIKAKNARQLVVELVGLEYIELHTPSGVRKTYLNTIKGHAFANATAAKPIKRATANLRVAEFLERIDLVNDDPHVHYLVKHVDIFGSYLTDKEILSDVDLIVFLELKQEKDIIQPSEEDRWARIFGDFRALYDADGQRLYTSDDETFRYLKNRKRSISICRPDGVDHSIERRTIYPVIH